MSIKKSDWDSAAEKNHEQENGSKQLQSNSWLQNETGQNKPENKIAQ
jgi:hypothetical protein